MSRYERAASAGPIGNASSASRVWRALRSTSEKTAAVGIPIARHVRATRTAIPPRFAMSTLRKSGMAPGECSIANVDDALRLRRRETAASFLVCAALALALAWPSLTWPMVYDDLHQVRG